MSENTPKKKKTFFLPTKYFFFSFLSFSPLFLLLSSLSYINLAVVTPQSFEIFDKEPSLNAIKSFVPIGRVLQSLFNWSLLDDRRDKFLMALNPWIQEHFAQAREFFDELVDVPDPEDYLQV
jgi:hypothetical protein